MGGTAAPRWALLTITVALVAALAVPATASHVAPWQLRGAYWAPAPADLAGHGLALRLETVEAGDPLHGALMAGHASVSFSPPDDVGADGLGGLSFDLYLEAGACGGGAPRMMLRIDADGDDDFQPSSSSDLYVGAYPNDVLGGTCTTGAWVTYDLLDDASATWFPGGTPSAAIAALLAAHPNHEVHRVDLQFDNTVTPQFGPAVVWFDDVVIHDHTLSGPVGEVWCPQTVEPPASLFVPCPFVVA